MTIITNVYGTLDNVKDLFKYGWAERGSIDFSNNDFLRADVDGIELLVSKINDKTINVETTGANQKVVLTTTQDFKKQMLDFD